MPPPGSATSRMTTSRSNPESGCRSGGAREAEKVVHDLFEPEDFALDDFVIGALGRTDGETLLLDEQRRLDRRERIPNLVRHAGREHAERGEFFVTFDERLALD